MKGEKGRERQREVERDRDKPTDRGGGMREGEGQR